MKKIWLMAVLFFIGAALYGCGGAEVDENGENDEIYESTFVIRFGHTLATDHPNHVAAEVFKQEVEANSNGRIMVELYPAAQAFGGETQHAEAVMIGICEVSIAVADAVSRLVPEWGLVGLPYLFDSRESALSALDGTFGQELARMALDANLHVLGWGDAGFRYLTNNLKEITSLADLDGLNIRVMETPVHIALFRALGADPTPMPFHVLFNALQDGVVDAQENPIATFTTARLFEVQSYMTRTAHVFSAAPLFINLPFFESLPYYLQQVVTDAGHMWTEVQRQYFLDMEEEFFRISIDNGVTITELPPEQLQEFINAAQVIYPDIYAEFGRELIELARSYNN